jgi:hypothetical protein
MNDIDTTTKKDIVVVTEENAASLLQILLERGYFHKKDTTTTTTTHAETDGIDNSYNWNDATFPTPPSFGSTIPKRMYDIQDADLIAVKQNSTSDAATTRPSYVTLQRLMTDFRHELDPRGRWSIDDASEHFGVPESVIRQRMIPSILSKPETSEDEYVTITSSTNCEIKEIITTKYLFEKMDELWKKLQNNYGYLAIADVSQKELQLPLDWTEKMIEKHIQQQSVAKTTGNDHNETVKIMLNDHGSKVLVAQAYLDEMKNQIRQICLDATESIHLNEIANEKGWQLGWVSKITSDLNNELPGTFKKERTTTAICYIPYIYVDRQRHSILDFYYANGYITAHIAQSRFGVSGTEMKQFVLSTNDDSTMPTMVLNESVINPDVIVANLIEATREAVENHSWLDATNLHIPPDILEHHIDDARALFDHVLPQLNENAGVAVVRQDCAVFFSQEMIEDFQNSHLNGLVESSAKELAQAIFHSNENNTPTKACLIEEDDIPQSGKEKRKARKAKKHVTSSEIDSHATRGTYGSLPLTCVRNKLLEAHPSLIKLDASGEVSVLDDLCKLAFCTEDLDILYQKSVQRHIDLLDAEKASTIIKKEEVIGDFPSVDAAFEDQSCFATACFTVQALNKFLTYATESEFLDNTAKDALQQDFLMGVCADFTSRVTQFALYKNGVTEYNLTFYVDDSGLEIRPFYNPVELATRSYGNVYLSSNKRGLDGKKDPLPILREVLPGNVGVAIARQWILCGGETYQGGTKAASEEIGEAYTRPGDIEGFLHHVKENCLTICGIPFTNLDKKAEKKYLNARRQRLMSCLEAASDASDALDLTIMLLYQLVKNFVVAGNLLRGPVLHLLVKERKVSEETAKELLSFAAELDEGKFMDQLKIDRIKSLAKSKV